MTEETSSTELDGLVKKKEELLGEVKSLKAKLSSYEGIDPEEYSKLKQEETERKQKSLESKGKYEEALKQREVVWQAKIDEQSKEIAKLKTEVHKHVAEQQLVNELTAVGGIPKFLLPLLLPQLQVVEESGRYETIVVDETGQRVPKSVQELVKEASQDPAYAPVFTGSKASGAPSGQPAANGAGGSKFYQFANQKENPYSKEGWNRTKQAQLEASDPAAAERYKQVAGVAVQ